MSVNSRKAPRPGARSRRATRAPQDRGSIYARVTDRIIAELEAGTIPWVRPWGSATGAAALPSNAATGRSYSGINILLLWGAAMEHGYPLQSWLTFRQALGLGGCVAKGEKGMSIVYADRFTPERERDRASQAGEEAKSIAFLKSFTVFNVAQCEGLPEHLLAAAEPAPERIVLEGAETLIANSRAVIRIGGDKAFYSPSDDFVQMPPQCLFADPIDFYRTELHELGHWTGHPGRLGRDQSGRFGSAAYAREELVAELSAAFLCASLSIEPTLRHASYIDTWLEVLRADERAIFRAASQASKAADYLLTFRPTAVIEEAAA